MEEGRGGEVGEVLWEESCGRGVRGGVLREGRVDKSELKWKPIFPMMSLES